MGRVNLYKRYPDSLKPVHVLPALFVLGVVLLLVLAVCWSWWFVLPILFYAVILWLDATVRTKRLKVGLLAVAASFIQVMGYGIGFLKAFWKVLVLKDKSFIEHIDSF
jgi:UDP-N-acetylmuramyl pentapeptide phosphotransferase/UDP-N-acetylglucosamine-1-phosphate transferase